MASKVCQQFKPVTTLSPNSECSGDWCSYMADGTTCESVRWFSTFSTKTCSSQSHNSWQPSTTVSQVKPYSTISISLFTICSSPVYRYCSGLFWNKMSTMSTTGRKESTIMRNHNWHAKVCWLRWVIYLSSMVSTSILTDCFRRYISLDRRIASSTIKTFSCGSCKVP